MKFKSKQCQDGEWYEIIEIQGPKASGFFVHFCETVKIKFFLKFFVSAERRRSPKSAPGVRNGRKVPPGGVRIACLCYRLELVLT